MKRIWVFVKAVPQTTSVSMDESFRLQRDRSLLEWNPADESALEAALRLREEGDSVTVCSMGPEKLKDPLRELLSRGADRAVLLSHSTLAGSDTYATALALSRVIQREGGADLILCGRRTVDSETGQVPGMIAEALGMPSLSGVGEISRQGERILLSRRTEQGEEKWNGCFPITVSLLEYSYPLRRPSLSSLRKAKDKTVEKIGLEEIGGDKNLFGLNGSLTKVISAENRFPGLRRGPKETDPVIAAKFVAKALREVAK